MELVIHLASQASPELCWHGIIPGLWLKLTWVHPLCTAGQFQLAFSSLASFLIGVCNPPGLILSLLLQHLVTINRPRKLGLDSSHFWKQQPEPLILGSKISTKRTIWPQKTLNTLQQLVLLKIKFNAWCLFIPSFKTFSQTRDYLDSTYQHI